MSCPYHEKLNPNNMMPELPNESSQGQNTELSKERTRSSIPKSEGADGPGANSSDPNWYYPSPQQFYNALKKKDMAAPEEHIETMVDIHNFLNEEVWKEVMQWEASYDCKNIQLVRFQGKVHSPSPKSRLYGLFTGNVPFDRHDWTINRCGQEVRYIIDYYEGKEENGNPTFVCDVRPALDSPQAVLQRMRQAMKDLMY